MRWDTCGDSALIRPRRDFGIQCTVTGIQTVMTVVIAPSRQHVRRRRNGCSERFRAEPRGVRTTPRDVRGNGDLWRRRAIADRRRTGSDHGLRARRTTASFRPPYDARSRTRPLTARHVSGDPSDVRQIKTPVGRVQPENGHRDTAASFTEVPRGADRCPSPRVDRCDSPSSSLSAPAASR